MITRSLDKARRAFRKRDVESSRKAHQKAEGHTAQGKYIKSVVYGGLDGIITTFAVVAGVAGAKLGAGVLLILGFANLIADGISMGVGDFLSTKSEQRYHQREREREEWEVENNPEGEKQEMKEIYEEKGFAQKEAEEMVKILSQNKKAWIDTMMVEELGLYSSKNSAAKNGAITFISFTAFGFIPLITYVLTKFANITLNNFAIATILTAAALFLLGSARTKITGTHWLRGGTEMLIVGGLAATAAYLVGAGVARIV